MAISELKGSTVVAKLWAPLSEIESGALDQVRNVASMPWVRHVAIMPDVHFGHGASVGSVVAMKGAVSAAMCGVDLGCGMAAMKTNLKAKDLPDSLKLIRAQIERDIPHGFNSHAKMVSEIFAHKSGINQEAKKLWSEFKDLHQGVQNIVNKAEVQLGTLGGGNHFVELCLDTEDNVWMMLHSGSRNIGKSLAEIHIAIARGLIHNQKLPDKDLGVFLAGTEEMKNYRRDLFWAQRYALLNRQTMLELYIRAMLRFFPHMTTEEPITCHHNYISEEVHFGEELFVTRKGAISAQVGQKGIIPGSMGAKSYIVEGLGNPDSLTSASHGAGRKMSRGAAKRQFTLEDLQKQTAGVECRKDAGVIDEIPGCYKSIEQVMANQSDLVKVIAELKAVLCVKG
jgi:tRNA-splicing ligase RtcB